MSRILHLSDLHFGRDDPELAEPLLETVHSLAPELVVISGDFTQRARVAQFARARAFVDRIPRPVLAVPGNHDTPLDNVPVRALNPWGRYRTAFGEDLEPTWSDQAVAVAGLNTVNRFSWQRGRLSQRRVARACRALENAGERVRIAVMHHPLQHGPEVKKRLMRGAREALRAFDACGVDIILSGHLHRTVVGPVQAAPGLLFVQAGTGLSLRQRGEPNTFNVLDVSRKRVEISTWAATDHHFRPVEGMSFRRDEKGWVKEGD
ncbi:metallophosphoesterase family protein [Histidinibacterium lentulum]|uniref:Metallophosphoesterase n=1 Tax=Histidinibacterium lentulum TaxID=2480588 RepID=A0A3N2R717_9RHOB|nr:metallophosphoesterase family protein [Histidinibacterium lentulum]ROU03173.1 metallophosphoesterase [Histidinibacterium lentulum]